MKVSYVIVTYNRREALRATLRQLFQGKVAHPGEWEAIVIDNASTDGTREAVVAEFPEVRYFMRPRNEGVGARSAGFEPARGEYVVLLDDDSYPVGDAVPRSIAHMESHTSVGAVVGKVVLPDGGEEGCALPGVMLSGAVCIRKEVILKVGGEKRDYFRREFFRKGGEYDFSYRIWAAGFEVVRLEDVVYRHDKVMTGRSKALAHRMDLRNNLILVERYLPAHLRRYYREDAIQRYSALARHDGFNATVFRARFEAELWRMHEITVGRQTLSGDVIESLFEHRKQTIEVSEFAMRHRIQRVAIADFSKNLYATWNACVSASVEVVAIWDDHPAYRGLVYRGIPVLPRGSSVEGVEGVVVSNINPAQCRRRVSEVMSCYAGPVLGLWEPQYSLCSSKMEST